MKYLNIELSLTLVHGSMLEETKEEQRNISAL